MSFPQALLSTFLRQLPRALSGRVFSRLTRWMPTWVALPTFYAKAALTSAPSINMRLNPTDTGHQRIAWLGEYEQELSDYIGKLALQGGTLLDVGANYGYFTLLWCAARPDNQVVAVEASPRNLPFLRENIERNGFASRVQVCDWAASDTSDGSVLFDLGPDSQTGWGGIAHEVKSSVIEVACHRLDQQLSNRQFAVMKIDCEGADIMVLRGSSGLLKHHQVKHIFFEENLVRMNLLGLKPEEAKEMMSQHGYELTEFASSEFHAYPL